MNCVFVQIDTNLINADKPKDISDWFYNTFWHNKKSDGFYRPDSFWEIPQWIAELSYTLPDNWSKELYIVTDIDKAIEYLNSLEYLDGLYPDYIFISCMDSNKLLVEKIIENLLLGIKVIVGGYCKPDLSYYAKYTWGKNVYSWYDNIQDYCKANQIEYKYGLDYSLFKGYKTIPRLTLSTGCTHKCKFCTIENDIIQKNMDEISQQIESFKSLDFRLVYINDKTFGQTKNYRHLKYIYNSLKADSPNFEGFIVQTTCNQIAKPGFIQELKNFGVKYVELGIETFNDDVLKAMRKPQNSKTIHQALRLLHNSGIQVIGNIIIGLPGETLESYRHTIKMLKMYRFYSLNIYNLALYDDAELANDITILENNDSNELIKNKSYHSKSDRKAIDWFYNRVYRLGLQIVGDK